DGPTSECIWWMVWFGLVHVFWARNYFISKHYFIKILCFFHIYIYIYIYIYKVWITYNIF
ncbi:MAG: hypothetical protein N7Q72_01425, partial [Spiroplasma sp. Tabriz.8]|nr:hypothetical protein [Spiroplasma sp. Tabriz.8]